MTKPILYVFSISHYCEKAKWALDHLGVDYQLSTLMPGTHIKVAKGLGLKRGSLPILQVDDTVIQGSSDIVQWAESKCTNGRTLRSQSPDVLEVVDRLDHTIGIHVRRHYYSEALVEHSNDVRAIFMSGLPLLDKLKLRLAWPTIRKLMISAMDLGAQQGVESYHIALQELDWLDEQIKSSGDYLCGDELSLADITAASLIAPYIGPKAHPLSGLIGLPPRLAAQIAGWEHRPSWSWVESLYAQHR